MLVCGFHRQELRLSWIADPLALQIEDAIALSEIHCIRNVHSQKPSGLQNAKQHHRRVLAKVGLNSRNSE